ncbi:zinc ribbon domain-containing protein [Agromyces sp. NPDC058484]|uniref:zinc ribbon domain-containing protein n=1 Tax=Agromyces sp. NPDC058484 TaxID=3346524 RepID=UPI00364914CE
MYCSNCGQPVSGNFCSHCGHPVAAPDGAKGERSATTAAVAESAVNEATDPSGWMLSLDFERVAAVPDVEQQIRVAASNAPSRMSGEAMLEGLGTLMDLVGIDGRIFTVGNSVGPALGKLGLNMGKARTETYTTAPGVLLAAGLISFAHAGMPVLSARQFDDGCVIQVSLPTDVWTWKGGTMTSAFQLTDAGATEVQAVTHVVGQSYDWGKSKRVLSKFFSDLQAMEDTWLEETDSSGH